MEALLDFKASIQHPLPHGTTYYVAYILKYSSLVDTVIFCLALRLMDAVNSS